MLTVLMNGVTEMKRPPQPDTASGQIATLSRISRTLSFTCVYLSLSSLHTFPEYIPVSITVPCNLSLSLIAEVLLGHLEDPSPSSSGHVYNVQTDVWSPTQEVGKPTH